MQKSKPTAPPTAKQLEASLLFNKAVQSLRKNQLTQAEKQLRNVVSLDPGATAGWANLALVLTRLKRDDEAIAAVQKAIRLAPQEAVFVAQQATIEWAAGRDDEALVSARRALALDPKNLEALRTLSGVLVAKKRFAEAMPTLRTWVALQPKDPTVLGTLATIQLQADQPTEALGTLRTMNKRFPKDTNGFLMRGDVAARLGEKKGDKKLLAEARDSYRRAFTLSPKNLRAGFNAAIAAERAGDNSGAVTLLEKLRATFPEAAMVRHSLALAYLRDTRRTPENRVTLGLKEAEAAVGREPKNAEYAATLGYMLLSQGSSRELGARAARVFQGALSLAPKNERARRGLIEALLVQSAWDDALVPLNALVQEKPDDDSLRRKLAATYQAAGKIPEAVSELRTLAARNPKDLRPLRDLGALLESQGLLEEAEKTWQQIQAREPENVSHFVRLGQLQSRQKRYEAARASYEAALAKQPNLSDAYAGLVQILEAEARPADALALRERWFKAVPSSNTVRYELAMLYADAGRDDEAVSLLKGLTLQKSDPKRDQYRQALSTFYRKKSRYSEEVQALRSLALEEPGNEGHQRLLAEALERAGRTDEAEQLLRQLIARSPANDLSYRIALIHLRERTGKIDDAVREAEELVTLRTSVPEARGLLIQLRTKQKSTEQIAPFFEKVALSEPYHPNPYLVVALDEWLAAQNAPERYLAFTQRLIAQYPKSNRAWKFRATALEKNKALTEAQSAWERATELDPSDAEAPLYLGQLLEGQGKNPEAIKAYSLSAKRLRTPAALQALKRLGVPAPK